MRLFHLDDIGPHYAQTLKLWWDNCCRHIDEIRALGYSDTFLRLWQFYLCYCEGAFRERYIGVVQLVLTKAECRRPSLVGGY